MVKLLLKVRQSVKKTEYLAMHNCEVKDLMETSRSRNSSINCPKNRMSIVTANSLTSFTRANLNSLNDRPGIDIKKALCINYTTVITISLFAMASCAFQIW